MVIFRDPQNPSCWGAVYLSKSANEEKQKQKQTKQGICHWRKWIYTPLATLNPQGFYNQTRQVGQTRIHKAAKTWDGSEFIVRNDGNMEIIFHRKKHQHNNTQNMKEPWTNIHMLKEQIGKNSFWSNLWNKIIQEKRWCKETIERIWFQLRDFDPKKAAIRKGLHEIAKNDYNPKKMVPKRILHIPRFSHVFFS